MLDLYKNIRTRRKELKMTQTELALKVGYTNKSSVASVEKGVVDLPLHKIHDFANALQTTPMALMGWDEPEADDAIEAAASLINNDDPLLNRLITAYNGMDDQKRELLVQLAENMK